MNTTIAAIIDEQARLRPDAAALVFEDRVTTYAGLARNAACVANALHGDGLKAGDRIAYLGKNSDVYFELLLGAMKARMIMAPLSWRLTVDELHYMLSDCGAETLFVADDFLATAADLNKRLLSLNVIALSQYEQWRDRACDVPPAPAPAPEDIALLLYTSGTTGRPKGAMLSHKNLLRLGVGGIPEDPAWFRWEAGETALIAMPIFHIGGTGQGIRALKAGARAVILREFDVERVLHVIAHYRIGRIFIVPSAMQALLRHPRCAGADLSSLRYVLYGASPIPLDLLRECVDRFGCGFVQMYGMTETSGTVVALPPEDHDAAGGPRMRSAGKALPGVELAILDERGEPLPSGRIGEVGIRSAASMHGYWQQPQATAQAFTSGGFFRTGDVGSLDEDGYLYIHDRVKDMIISGGENIYPAEVENAIFGHPHVAEVAVIGVPSPRWGEEVKAMVVLKSGAAADSTSIIEWARARIAAYKTPKSIDFVDSLPRNDSGKILRRQLREPYWRGVERRVS